MSTTTRFKAHLCDTSIAVELEVKTGTRGEFADKAAAQYRLSEAAAVAVTEALQRVLLQHISEDERQKLEATLSSSWASKEAKESARETLALLAKADEAAPATTKAASEQAVTPASCGPSSSPVAEAAELLLQAAALLQRVDPPYEAQGHTPPTD